MVKYIDKDFKDLLDRYRFILIEIDVSNILLEDYTGISNRIGEKLDSEYIKCPKIYPFVFDYESNDTSYVYSLCDYFFVNVFVRTLDLEGIKYSVKDLTQDFFNSKMDFSIEKRNQDKYHDILLKKLKVFKKTKNELC